jgi:hypothetical protein
MGYLPRVLFFNAFELGAESGNQVISSDADKGVDNRAHRLKYP